MNFNTKIRILLQKDDVDGALKIAESPMCRNGLNADEIDKLVILRATWERLKSDYIKGVLSRQEASIQQNALISNFLLLTFPEGSISITDNVCLIKLIIDKDFYSLDNEIFEELFLNSFGFAPDELRFGEYYPEDNKTVVLVRLPENRAVELYEERNKRKLNTLNVKISDRLCSFKDKKVDNVSNPYFRGAILNGYDFSKQTIKAADFRASIINNSNFSSAELISGNFKGAVCNRTNFDFAVLNGSNFDRLSQHIPSFQDAYLENTSFFKAELNKISFKKATVFGANFRRGVFRNINFDDISSYSSDDNSESKVDFSSGEFFNTSFVLAKIPHADFSDSKFFATRFIAANLTNASFTGSEFVNSFFQNCKIENGDFRNCKFFIPGDFQEIIGLTKDKSACKVESVQLINTLLSSCVMQDVIWHDVNFTDSNLKNSSISSSQFHNTEFFASNTANLTIEASQFLASRFLESTLENTKAKDCNFDFSVFNNSDLTNSRFENSSFKDVSFKKVNFRKAHFSNCDFTLSSFKECENLDFAIFDKCTFNRKFEPSLEEKRMVFDENESNDYLEK